MSSNPSALSAASQDRKARLAQLRSLKRKQPDPNPDSQEEQNEDGPQTTDLQTLKASESEDVKQKYLSGRNYDHTTGTAKLGFEHAPDAEKDTLERKAAELEERVRLENAEKDKKDEPLDLFKLQPKKPNWDLKRDLKQRMEILDVRTDNAIAKLVRDRIETQKKKVGGSDELTGLEGVDLVEAVHVREREEAEEEAREREWEQGLTNGEP